MLAPVIIAAPAAAPVSLEEAKLHCRVEGDAENTLITGLVSAAVAYLDGYIGILGRALVTQTWRQDFCRFGAKMRLPLRPVGSITVVTYFDGNNAEQTLPSSVYDLFTDATGSYMGLKPDQDWPSSYDRPDAISVTYIAGVAADAVPPPIKQAILLMVGHWYANREAVSEAQMNDVPMAVEALLRPYRSVGI